MVVAGEADDDTQRWRLSSDREHLWRITHVATGKRLLVRDGRLTLGAVSDDASSLWSIEQTNPEYAVPAPRPVNTDRYLVGIEMSNLWDVATRPNCWNELEPFPDRKPVTGYYREGMPKLVDWDTKMVTESGIGFFMDCWFRAEPSVGKPEVSAIYDHWIRGLAQARYKNRIKFMILWINIAFPGTSGGIRDKSDFVDNLAPYLANRLFRNPNYLIIDGKPVISIFDAPTSIESCGGRDQAREAIA